MKAVSTVVIFLNILVACTLHAQEEIPQNSPCGGQARTRAALQRAFNAGRIPSMSELTGSWVAIGFFGRPSIGGPEFVTLNCNGLKRVDLDGMDKFDQVLLFRGSSVETHIMGAFVQSLNVQRRAREIRFGPIDMGGDASPVYRCRLTSRGTLACLVDVYREGIEFTRMTVKAQEVPSNPG